MKTRKVTDKMLRMFQDACVWWSYKETVTDDELREKLDGVLNGERRTSERRKPVELLERIERQMERKGLQGKIAEVDLELDEVDRRLKVGAYAPLPVVEKATMERAPCGALKDTPAKGEDGAAPAKPAAVEGNYVAHRRAGDHPCFLRWHGRRGEQVAYGGFALHSRKGDAGERDHRRSTDPNIIQEHYTVADKLTPERAAEEASKFDLAAKRARPLDLAELDAKLRHTRRASDHTHSEPTVGATHAPSQDTTRPSASTTAAPEVSEAMLEAAEKAVPGLCLPSELTKIFRAMYLKMLSEQANG